MAEPGNGNAQTEDPGPGPARPRFDQFYLHTEGELEPLTHKPTKESCQATFEWILGVGLLGFGPGIYGLKLLKKV